MILCLWMAMAQVMGGQRNLISAKVRQPGLTILMSVI
jgi:hypothetical protein